MGRGQNINTDGSLEKVDSHSHGYSWEIMDPSLRIKHPGEGGSWWRICHVKTGCLS